MPKLTYVNYHLWLMIVIHYNLLQCVLYAINDIGDVLCGDRCTCKLYADDVKLYTTLCVNDDIKHMQNRLNVLYTWSNTSQLNISTSKCAAMQSHAVTECSNLHLNNIAITKAHDQGSKI